MREEFLQHFFRVIKKGWGQSLNYGLSFKFILGTELYDAGYSFANCSF